MRKAIRSNVDNILIIIATLSMVILGVCCFLSMGWFALMMLPIINTLPIAKPIMIFIQIMIILMFLIGLFVFIQVMLYFFDLRGGYKNTWTYFVKTLWVSYTNADAVEEYLEKNCETGTWLVGPVDLENKKKAVWVWNKQHRCIVELMK